MTITKSTSRRQGCKGDRASEGIRSANLRADGQKPHIRPNLWAREHNIPKPVWRTCGRVNAAVVQGKIMFLLGEICQSKLRNGEVGIGRIAEQFLIDLASVEHIVKTTSVAEARKKVKSNKGAPGKGVRGCS